MEKISDSSAPLLVYNVVISNITWWEILADHKIMSYDVLFSTEFVLAYRGS